MDDDIQLTPDELIALVAISEDLSGIAKDDHREAKRRLTYEKRHAKRSMAVYERMAALVAAIEERVESERL